MIGTPEVNNGDKVMSQPQNVIVTVRYPFVACVLGN